VRHMRWHTGDKPATLRQAVSHYNTGHAGTITWQRAVRPLRHV